MRGLVALALLAALPVLADAACPVIHRSDKVLREFQRLHPCPSTGKPTGRCDGWVRDHVWPLCAGGLDTVENLVWSPVTEAKLKDRWERAMCQRLGCTRK